MTLLRITAAIIAIAGVALLASACGGSAGSHVARLGTTVTQPGPSSTSSGASGRSLALEYSACMRSHGVSKFPDLTELNRVVGELPKISVSMEQLGVSSSQFQTAQTACRHLLPNGGRTTASESQQDLNAMRRFARCMRSHGVPTWPDPVNGPAGWGFNLLNVHGFDPNSPQIDSKMHVCERELPAGTGIPVSSPGTAG
jgi:hypothetical protein